MATFTKRNGKTRVQVRVNGLAKPATFNTKSEAKLWAAIQENGADVSQTQVAVQVATGKHCPANFAEILIKYRNKVTVLWLAVFSGT